MIKPLALVVVLTVIGGAAAADSPNELAKTVSAARGKVTGAFAWEALVCAGFMTSGGGGAGLEATGTGFGALLAAGVGTLGAAAGGAIGAAVAAGADAAGDAEPRSPGNRMPQNPETASVNSSST